MANQDQRAPSAAFILGVKVFDAGRQCIPMQDSALMGLLVDCTSVSDQLDQWVEGWDLANRMAPVPGWTAEENAKMVQAIDPTGSKAKLLLGARNG